MPQPLFYQHTTLTISSIKGLLIFFGPVLLPKLFSYYRSVKNAPRPAGVSIQPVSPPIRSALFLLAFLSFVFLCKTLPIFSPENLFLRTDSRLQIPTDVLFNRISALRPNNVLTATDESLRSKFINLESRLLYLQYGPSVLADCPFCNSDEARTYFYYAAPAIFWPHLANLVAIAIATSSAWTGRYGSQWRTYATIAASILVGLEIYLVNSYNHHKNSHALRIGDVDFFYWSIRNYRHIALAGLDALLGWVIWLSATNRAFVKLPSTAERVEMVNRNLQAVRSKLNAVGIIKNTAMRDEQLRHASEAYWQHEVRLMGEVMEEREVVEGVNDALENRINIQNVTKDADTYAGNVLQALHNLQNVEEHNI